MAHIKWILLMALIVGLSIPAHAEIYHWIDANGVKRYSNDPPPEGTKVLNQTAEIKHDKTADEARTRQDEKYMQETSERLGRERAEQEKQLEKQRQQAAADKEKKAQEDKMKELESEVEKLKKEKRRRYHRRPVVVVPEQPLPPSGPPIAVPLPSGAD